MAVIFALACLAFGLFLLLVAVLLLNGQRTNGVDLVRLRHEVERMEDLLRSPQERADRQYRHDRIEAQKRIIHGRFDGGGW